MKQLDEFILELYIEYSSASNPSERPLSSSQISIDNVTPHLDSIRKWIRELHDELLCTRAEIANEADPQTALSKLSYTTEDIDDLVQQLEEATGRFQLAENQLEENGRARQTKDEELHKVQAALDTLRVELAQVQSNEKAVVEEDKTHIAFQNFAVEDLILFLPTRNPIAWAAFNVNAPHYFLSIQEHRNFQSQIR